MSRRKNLTAAMLRGNLAAGKYYDQGGTGLYLRVKASGAKSWAQRITIHGKRCDLGLGPASLVGLAEARQKAQDNRRAVYEGRDPRAERQAALSVPTFADAAQRVYDLHRPTWKNEKHAAQFIGTLRSYAFPRLGAMKVDTISPADVLAVLSPIWNTKRETAGRVRQRIGMVMKWAVSQGHRTDNPADAISEALPKGGKPVTHRKAMPYAEVAEALRKIEASGAGLATKLALRFLVLTAARSGEVRGAKWGHIDWHAAGGPVWARPAALMKSGVAHAIPLSKAAVAVLEAAKGLSDCGDADALIFPGAIAGRPLSDMTLLKLVRENGFDVDIHGFRTSFRTWAQERTNFPREVAEAALAHTIKNKVEAAYARSDLMEKRRALGEAWAGFLEPANTNIVRIG